MIDPEDNLYDHMSVDEDDEIELPSSMPQPVSPRFSLAYLRRSSDPVALTTDEGRITFLNDPARIFLGIPSVEAAQGRDIWEYWRTEDTQAASDAIEDAVLAAATGAPQSMPVACPVSDDQVMRHGLMASPVIDADGRVESVFVVISDPD